MPTDYLRNRPFLTVELSQRPAPGVNTKIRGWQNDPRSMQTFERVSFLDRIKNKAGYSVIIDIINSAVIHNLSSRSESEVLATYLGKYRNEVTQALTVWAQNEAKKMPKEENDEIQS